MRACIVLNREPEDDLVELINLYNMCKEFNCLPKAGGLFDQDSYYVIGMLLVAQAYAEREELKRKQKKGQ